MRKRDNDTGERPNKKTLRRGNSVDAVREDVQTGPAGKTFWVFAFLLLIAVTAAYSNHFYNSFHFDDSHTIVNNSFIRSIRNIPLFFTDATTFSSLPANQSYRPLVVASLALDYFMGNGNIFFFHLSTFVLFLLQGALMYMLYAGIYNRSEQGTANRFVALAAVAWYLLHPANAETINYVIARSDSLSTLFIILAFAMYLYWDPGKRLHLYLIPFALACLAKPVGAMFAPLLLVYIYLFEENKGPRMARIGAALKKAAPALIACLLLLVFIKKMDPPTWRAGGASPFHYIITQPYVVLHYFTTFFAPLGLSADTDWTTLPSMLDIRFLTGSLFLAGLLATALATARTERLRPISFGILWFLISLLPTSLIPLAEVMNDHRLFLPYVGLTMGVCWALHLLLDKLKSSFPSERTFNRTVAALIIIALSIYAYGVRERNKVWLSDETLWFDVTKKSPKNGRGLMNYGLTLMARADYAGAERYFTDALRLTPNYSYLHTNMGIVAQSTGRPGDAERYFRNSISLDPNNPSPYYYYGVFLRGQNRPLEAVRNFIKALELAPAHLDARHALMSMYFERNETDKLRELAEQTLLIVNNDREAAAYLDAMSKGASVLDLAEESVRRNRTPESLLNLSLVYYKARQYRKSIEAAREALKLRPDYDLAYNNICAAYNELGQWDKAIKAGERAVRLNPNNQLAVNNLKAARKGRAGGK
jgi:tetratricopeptide (TPR) repeat protein